MAREPIEEGAIFIKVLDHYEYVFSPNGAATYRNDWRDREDECVMKFLMSKYPVLSHALQSA